MNVLIVGDVVGRSGLDKLKEVLNKTIEENEIDFCIVNGENSANGKGLRHEEYNEILSYGADAITMGNHMYYRKEMATEYIKLPKLLIPANITNLTGNGHKLIEKNGIKYGVINIIGRAEMGEIIEKNVVNPFKKVTEEIESLNQEGAEYIFVDFHAEATAEKIAMGYHLDGKVTCIFGTHTHIQTADEMIFESGTAYITDVGMTGPKDSVIGLKKEVALKRFVEDSFAKYECSKNPGIFNAVILNIDESTKKVTNIKRIFQR